MIHTDFYKLYKELDAQAQEELIAAVRAHGGEYIFAEPDEDGDFDYDSLNDCPIVMASTHSMDTYEDFFIVRLELVDNRYLHTYGVPKEDWCTNEMELDSIACGHMEYIIDDIPETEEVKSVIVPKSGPTPILILSPEDVENVGYDSNMTVAQLNELKRLMEKSFEWNMDIYWDALRQACENLGLPTLKTDESSTQ